MDEIIPENERKSTSESIKILMKSHDYHVNQRVMKFASSCRDIRNTLLLSNESDNESGNITFTLVLLLITSLLQYCKILRSCK